MGRPILTKLVDDVVDVVATMWRMEERAVEWNDEPLREHPERWWEEKYAAWEEVVEAEEMVCHPTTTRSDSGDGPAMTPDRATPRRPRPRQPTRWVRT